MSLEIALGIILTVASLAVLTCACIKRSWEKEKA